MPNYSGVWTLPQQMQAVAGGTWPVLYDPYFYDVSLLLTGDGTNGAQNNTFLDSSTNNFTITRNGNTTQGTFSPYGSLWSNYFDGSGDYLDTPSIALSNSDFTFEVYLYRTVNPANDFIFNGTTNGSFGVLFESSGSVISILFNQVSYIAQISSTVPNSQWFHLAVTRSGNSFRVFVNGVQIGSTATNSGSFATSAYRFGASLSNTFPYTGYMSNARLVIGTALYTSNFTPSTTPLTAVSGTSLLTCQSNRFIDNSSNNFTLTVNGNTSVQRFSPFNPTAAYSASTIGGSGYFDGTGDYLSVANNAAFSLASSAFTIEAWVYFANATTTQLIITTYGGATSGWSIQLDGGIIGFYATGDVPDIVGTTGIKSNTWYHIAVSGIAGSSIKLYVNGLQDGSTYTGNIVDSSANLNIGQVVGVNYFNGYISNLRVVKGTAVYTSNFTPPTSPLTAITNTSLLCNFTNAGIPDAAMMNDLETVGNAQVSTSVKKYGTGSLYFDGSGDELVAPATPNLVFGTGAFTVEAWIYANNAASGAPQDLIGNLTNAAGNTNWTLQLTSTGVLQAGTYNTLLASSGSAVVSSTSWTHVAFTYDGTTYRVFINGTVGTTTSTTQQNISDATNRIKVANTNFGTRYFNGYIDDLRITKGYARYTANFTPPDAALPTY